MFLFWLFGCALSSSCDALAGLLRDLRELLRREIGLRLVGWFRLWLSRPTQLPEALGGPVVKNAG